MITSSWISDGNVITVTTTLGEFDQEETAAEHAARHAIKLADELAANPPDPVDSEE